ncbi:MAG: hypothetical protein JRI57_09260 [Deltaproteobacteria bacterium]|nr:hypothetical protein [Deltaproteobacteria bacterium]MBW1987645.1 hypothetical protein [Deltaproteobacteria bacterium]
MAQPLQVREFFGLFFRLAEDLADSPGLLVVFQEVGNQRHGLKKARYWGLVKLSIQSFMVAIVVNLKRLARLAFLAAPQPRLAWTA